MTIEDIIFFLEKLSIEYRYDGKKDRGKDINSFCPLNQLREDSITWVRNKIDVPIEQMNSMNNIVLFAKLGEEVEGALFPVIYVDNVHRTFFRVLENFFGSLDPEQDREGIESTAVVETTDIGEHVYIGHHTYIGKDVIIGSHVHILNNVTIQGKVSIGDYTVIESGTTIGACGYGHYKDESGNPVCVPHLGGVIIGHHVKIGANNAISRGCLADTIIEDYVKTDNLCHIAHNDIIKCRAMLTANTVISGSTTIGENVWTAPGSLLNNSITIGDNAFLGLGAVATKNVAAGKIVVGMPAKELRDRK